MARARQIGLAIAILALATHQGAEGQRSPGMIPRGVETLRFDSERILVSPSASLRSFVLAGVSIPPEGRSISVRCSLGRERGGVAVCDIPRGEGEIEHAAAEIAEHYRFRLDDEMNGPASMLAVTIPLRISPSDMRSAATDAPLIPFSQVSFERRASAEELGDMYPWRYGNWGETPTVQVECEISADLSLFCVDPQVEGLDSDHPAFRDFQLAALQASGFFRSAAVLANGQAAPGNRFRMAFRFQPASRDK